MAVSNPGEEIDLYERSPRRHEEHPKYFVHKFLSRRANSSTAVAAGVACDNRGLRTLNTGN